MRAALLFSSLVLLLSACATPQAPAILTPTPTDTPTPQPTATRRPSLTPTITPTLPGPDITRTPAPRAQCPQPSNRPFTFTYSEQLKDFETQILNYLNTRGSVAGLQVALNRLGEIVDDQFRLVQAQIISQDVTGDQAPDHILELFYPDSSYGDLFVFTCQAGKYKSHLLTFRNYDELLAITDMNGNGAPEIVFIQREYLLGRARNFIISEWDGTTFWELRDPLERPIWGGDGLITDTDGNGTLELDVSGAVLSPHYGSGRTVHQVWAWDGEAFTLSRTYADPPVWRYEAAAQGDVASQASFFETAYASYQRVIFDDSLFAWGEDQDPLNPQPGVGNPDERARLSAYARYRLLLLDTFGNVDEARREYETLQNQYPPDAVGHEYAEVAAFFWQEYTTSNIWAACESVFERYNHLYPREITVPIGAQASSENKIPFYDICPFRTILI